MLRRGGAGCSISRRISACPALRRSPARRMALALPLAWPRGRHSQAAARSAVLEMCQGELAHAVVEAKCRERGEAALNERDRVHRRRATMINADRCLLLQPVAEPCASILPSTPPIANSRAAAHRGTPGAIRHRDLWPRPDACARFAIPVARVIAPGLQLEPSEIVTPRLADMMARTGGGAIYTGGVALI